LGLWYGDFYSQNESYPFMIDRHQRRRMWMNKETGKVFRLEIAKTIVGEIT
jgi:hypothetical protein